MKKIIINNCNKYLFINNLLLLNKLKLKFILDFEIINIEDNTVNIRENDIEYDLLINIINKYNEEIKNNIIKYIYQILNQLQELFIYYNSFDINNIFITENNNILIINYDFSNKNNYILQIENISKQINSKLEYQFSNDFYSDTMNFLCIYNNVNTSNNQKVISTLIDKYNNYLNSYKYPEMSSIYLLIMINYIWITKSYELIDIIKRVSISLRINSHIYQNNIKLLDGTKPNYKVLLKSVKIDFNLLGEYIKYLSELKSLDISNHELYIINAFIKKINNPKLEEINLSCNKLYDSTNVLFDKFKTHTNLKILHLDSIIL